MPSAIFELRVDYDGGLNSEYSYALYSSRAKAEAEGRRLAAEVEQPFKHYKWMSRAAREKWQRKMLGGWRVVRREVL